MWKNWIYPSDLIVPQNLYDKYFVVLQIIALLLVKESEGNRSDYNSIL